MLLRLPVTIAILHAWLHNMGSQMLTASPLQATLHAAVQSDKQDVQMSLRFMRWLLKNNRSVAEHCWGPLSTEINKEAAAVPQEDAQDDTNQAPGNVLPRAGH